MRWLFLILSIVSAGVAYKADTSGLLGTSMVLTMLFAFISVMGFVQSRIETVSQPQANMIGGRDVEQIRKQAVLKKVQQVRAQANQVRPQTTDLDSDN